MPYNQPLEESILIFKHMVKTGCGKVESINKLYEQGVLSKESYLCDCPLCEEHREPDSELIVQCGLCPWNIMINGKNNVYMVGCQSSTIDWRRDSRQDVVRFLESLREQDTQECKTGTKQPEPLTLKPGDVLTHPDYPDMYFDVVDDGDNDDCIDIVFKNTIVFEGLDDDRISFDFSDKGCDLLKVEDGIDNFIKRFSKVR